MWIGLLIHARDPNTTYSSKGAAKNSDLPHSSCSFHCSLLAEGFLRALAVSTACCHTATSLAPGGFAVMWSATMRGKRPRAIDSCVSCRCIERAPLSLEKLSIQDDIVTYTTKDGAAHEFEALEFLAALSCHVPEHHAILRSLLL